CRLIFSLLPIPIAANFRLIINHPRSSLRRRISRLGLEVVCPDRKHKRSRTRVRRVPGIDNNFEERDLQTKIQSTLITALIGSMLAGCGGSSQDSLESGQKQMVRSVKAATACYTAWSSSTAYNGGANVSYSGV